jgi:REP element-mobilizing transposase RayT
MSEVCADFGVTLVEPNGEDDHVHLLVEHPPTVQLSWLVNSLKGVSARVLRRDHPSLVRKFLWGKPLLVPDLLRRIGRWSTPRCNPDLYRATAHAHGVSGYPSRP